MPTKEQIAILKHLFKTNCPKCGRLVATNIEIVGEIEESEPAFIGGNLYTTLRAPVKCLLCGEVTRAGCRGRVDRR